MGGQGSGGATGGVASAGASGVGVGLGASSVGQPNLSATQRRQLDRWMALR
jgi:hypothetical protein